jgi:hypothetical protein
LPKLAPNPAAAFTGTPREVGGKGGPGLTTSMMVVEWWGEWGEETTSTCGVCGELTTSTTLDGRSSCSLSPTCTKPGDDSSIPEELLNAPEHGRRGSFASCKEDAG